ncbi:FtsB family cell division protein [Knoellia subterranea]|uniref:Septation ring formation regulator EzrA n=1 Tax=Knoellia subterranea KCTC 19937 TaxID=1385521 RepID=A0A0A0JH61_9MICO|nr:septum formation initiator family protein [Knoellia subterranea]KGN36463.1 septation ring formation regulator EzrA [Knoellia subterranea KCTC 19937]
MARGSSRGPGTSPRRPASSRPSPRAKAPREARSSRASRDTATRTAVNGAAGAGSDHTPLAAWRGRLNAARSNRRTVRRVGLAVVLLFLVVLVAPTLRAYVQQRSDISALRDKVAQQKVTVEELQKEQARWEDPAYVEQQARTRLKFVKPGEKSYTVLDPEVDQRDPSVAHVRESTDPWYDTIWSSMQAADVPANQRR